MLIERNRYYVTRNGEKVGPMKATSGGFIGYFPDNAFPEVGRTYHPDGRRATLNCTRSDIVDVWREHHKDDNGGWVNFSLGDNGTCIDFSNHSHVSENMCRKYATENTLALVQFGYKDGKLFIKDQVRL